GRHHRTRTGQRPPGCPRRGLRCREERGRQSDRDGRQAVLHLGSHPARRREVLRLDRERPEALSPSPVPGSGCVPLPDMLWRYCEMSQIPAVLVDGIMYAAWLFLVALGLTLIYGVLKILNMAHGSLYALGAYAGVTLIGPWVADGGNLYVSYLLLVVAAMVAGAVIGVLLERGVLKRFYGQDPVVLLLVTYALFLIIEDGIKLIWGVDPYSVPEPYYFLGNFDIGYLSYP